MLTTGTVGNAALSVRIQDELVRAGTLVGRDTRLTVAFKQIRAGWWCDEAKM